ncbi:MAG TPA: ROK family transcriptional regulator [Treponemataceae bacterium]|nr:ROK family transcriptional regulator [Treponemataceae bacterium]
MQINNSFQKNANISMVAQLLWKTPGLSRVEIARNLELYRSTVSNIINTLIQNGVVYEEREGESMPQGGRKPICLDLNGRFGCVAGIEMQPDGYRAVIIDVFGTVLFSCFGNLPELPFIEIFDFIMKDLLVEVEKNTIPLLGICLGIPGIVDSNRGVILLSDPFNLENYDFASPVSARYRLPVLVENDANCLAWKELATNRGDNLNDFICLNAEYHKRESLHGSNAGMGVGIGLAIGGRVFAGSKYAAGEFVSGSWRKGSIGQTGLPLKAMSAIDKDDTAFSDWVNDLFSSLVSVVSVFNPEAFFAHGELARRSSFVLSILEERIPQFQAILEKSNSSLIFGDGSDDLVAIGAAQMFFLELFSVPGCNSNSVSSHIDWDTVFEIVARKL